MEEVLSKVEKKRGFLERLPFLKNYYFLGGIVLILLIIIGVLVFYSPSQKVSALQKCGDGTFEGYCSLNKPYFCSNEILVSNSSQCGCFDSFKFSKEKCLSSYSDGNLSLFDYVLDGNKSEIPFLIYPGLVDYLSNLSRAKIYYGGEIPRRDDFKLSKIEEPTQRDYLMPLVAEIENLAPNSKDLQAKIAISLVQNIPYKESDFGTVPGFSVKVRLARYPYQVLEEDQGSCEGKSELLAFLLKEMDFGVTLFYFPNEDHEAVGIKCPLEESYLGTGYCFVETTMPSPISFSEGKYLGANGINKLTSKPQLVLISEGISLSKNLEDYNDAKTLTTLVDKIDSSGSLNPLDNLKMNSLREKYNLEF